MIRTRSGLPKHCTYQQDRYGQRRVRFRRRGVSVYLTGIPWSEDFMRQYAAALEREEGNRAQIGAAKRTLPGSFSALCVSYYGSPEFRGLKASTQRVRRNVLERFRAEHPRLAIALLLYTAQRRGDVVRIGWQHLQGDSIAVRQEKTNSPLLIPVHPELAHALASVPRTNLTFLITERGRPFTSASFGNWFRKRCNEAGLLQCSAHGLRKCAATRLADAGCSLHRIMAVTGHKSMSSVAPYTKRADQARLAREAFETQIRAEREQNLPNSETQVYPTAKKR